MQHTGFKRFSFCLEVLSSTTEQHIANRPRWVQSVQEVNTQAIKPKARLAAGRKFAYSVRLGGDAQGRHILDDLGFAVDGAVGILGTGLGDARHHLDALDLGNDARVDPMLA